MLAKTSHFQAISICTLKRTCTRHNHRAQEPCSPLVEWATYVYAHMLVSRHVYLPCGSYDGCDGCATLAHACTAGMYMHQHVCACTVLYRRTHTHVLSFACMKAHSSCSHGYRSTLRRFHQSLLEIMVSHMPAAEKLQSLKCAPEPRRGRRVHLQSIHDVAVRRHARLLVSASCGRRTADYFVCRTTNRGSSRHWSHRSMSPLHVVKPPDICAPFSIFLLSYFFTSLNKSVYHLRLPHVHSCSSCVKTQKIIIMARGC